MLIGRVRSHETRTLDEGEKPPAGWEFWNETKRIIRPTGPVEEIEADDMDVLLAKVPDGWQLLSVQQA